jgi:tetratricopeptide (TPR) repeat protein
MRTRRRRRGFASLLTYHGAHAHAFAHTLGNAYASLGDCTKAIEYHKQHLTMAKELGNRVGEGKAYGNLGCAYQALGDYSKTIEYHAQHLAIAKKVGDRAGEYSVSESGNLNAYHSQGNISKAIEYHEQRLTIARKRI